MDAMLLPGYDGVGIVADNPGPLTLTGTNSWIVGREPAWLIDPGPDLASHLDAISAEIDRRGGLGGILLTHSHGDHIAGLPEMRSRFAPVPVAGAGGDVDVILADGDRFGPLQAIATPGHAVDHLSFVDGDVVFSGDAVLGSGSVFVAPAPGALSSYLEGLERLRALRPRLLAPGHGPLVTDVGAKLDEYVGRRQQREQDLLVALGEGKRTVDELLDSVWSGVPASLRGAAGLTLTAHLHKLAEEGYLPDDVEWPGA